MSFDGYNWEMKHCISYNSVILDIIRFLIKICLIWPFTNASKAQGKLLKSVELYLALLFFSLWFTLFGVLPKGIYMENILIYSAEKTTIYVYAL